MEIGEKKIFDKDAAYERWDQKNQRRGNDKYFYEEEREESYLRELKGRIQNNTSGFLKVVLTALIVLAQVCIVMFFSLQEWNNLVLYDSGFFDRCDRSTYQSESESVLSDCMDLNHYAASGYRISAVFFVGAFQ